MLKRLIFSVIWGATAWLISAFVFGDYADSYWAARVARGGDPGFTDIGFTVIMATIGVGVFVTALGIVGILPGTKQNDISK